MAVDTAEDLYALPVNEFVAARDQLAKKLAADGDAEEAKRVKALRKPTVAAAALNQVAREQPDLVAALADAHQRLRSASSAEALRAASEARMDGIRHIVEAAEGVTDAVAKKMRSTLMAAATDPEAEEALVAGRLDRDLEPAGLGGFDAAVAFAPSRGKAPSATKKTTKSIEKKAESARTVKARQRVEKLQAEADAALEEARRLRTEADRAERLATAAEERAAARQARADEARRALSGE